MPKFIAIAMNYPRTNLIATDFVAFYDRLGMQRDWARGVHCRCNEFGQPTALMTPGGRLESSLFVARLVGSANIS